MSASVPLNRIIREGAHHSAATIDDIGQIGGILKPDEVPASALVGAFASRDLLDEIDDRAAHLRIRDSGERLGQGESFGSREEIRDVRWRCAFCEAVRPRHAARTALEQEGHRHLENFGNLLDAARADPVCALLVFLNLLESQAQSFTELFLAHAQHDAAHPHATADIFVNRVGRFRHFLSPPNTTFGAIRNASGVSNVKIRPCYWKTLRRNLAMPTVFCSRCRMRRPRAVCQPWNYGCQKLSASAA